MAVNDYRPYESEERAHKELCERLGITYIARPTQPDCPPGEEYSIPDFFLSRAAKEQ